MAFDHPGDVVVTGMGAVTPFGIGLAQLSKGLRGTLPPAFLTEHPAPLSFPVVRAPLPPIDLAAALTDLAPGLPDAARRTRRLAHRADPTVQAVTLAALEAWALAGLTAAPDPERAGIVVAAQNATTGQQYRLHEKFRNSPEWLSPAWGVGFMDSFPLGIASEALGLLGEGMTVGGASASGNLALIQAARMIRGGDADLCLVIAPPADLSPMEYQALSSLGAIGGHSFAGEPDRACRPFDRAAEGFIPGAAAAAVVLEAGEAAARRGAAPRAILAGGAAALSGNGHTVPDGAAELRAMELALRRAGLEPAEVDAVSAHATSTPLGDRTEAEALDALFGPRRVAVNAPKGLLGHGLWSAGLVEAVAAILQMEGGFLHPNRNLDDPVTDRLDLVGAGPRDAAIGAMLSNSFGFGGIHTAVVIRAALGQ